MQVRYGVAVNFFLDLPVPSPPTTQRQSSADAASTPSETKTTECKTAIYYLINFKLIIFLDFSFLSSHLLIFFFRLLSRPIR
jgi:hypothetical protein